MLRNYADSVEKLSNLIKKYSTIPDAGNPKIAILRPTQHFNITTSDNPDMKRSLKEQEDFIANKIASLENNNPTLTAEQKQEAISLAKTEYQKHLSVTAAEEQSNLIKILKENGIMTIPLLEDKTRVSPESDFDYYTDQIFATDTGQYYVNNDNKLCFIRGFFKNAQRNGEERLAVVQAENLGAEIKKLVDAKGNSLIFEGGDIRQMPGKKLFFIGQGHRSEPKTAPAIAQTTGYIVVPIILLQEQFYHLDCCFLPFPNQAAMIYEGEYVLDEHNQIKNDSNGWPMLVPGTATIDANSRSLIRHIYPSEKLITITKEEALAFATNAAIFQDKNGRFKMFVNGDPDRQPHSEVSIQEQDNLLNHKISLLSQHIEKIKKITNFAMDIIEIPFKTMHKSGGSVRCTIQEVACCKNSLYPYQYGNKAGSDAIDRIEQKMPIKFPFFEKERVVTGPQKKQVANPKEEPISSSKEEPINRRLYR